MLSCLPLVHLHPILVVEPGGTSTAPAPPSRARRDASGRKMAIITFFLSYRWELTIPASLLLNCILKNWDRFDPQGLKKTHLVFLCDTAWPRYPLKDAEQWPVGGSLKYNTVLHLDRFCRKQGKWVEVAYVLPFFSLRISQTYVLRV